MKRPYKPVPVAQSVANPFRFRGRYILYRGSYTSVHVLLNLLNELRKRDKMRGVSSILSLFRNELNKFNKTRAQVLDSILSYDIHIIIIVT